MEKEFDCTRTGAFNYREPFDYFYYTFQIIVPLSAFEQYIKEVEELVKKEIDIVENLYKKNQDFIDLKINEFKGRNTNLDNIDDFIWQFEHPDMEELLGAKKYYSDIFYPSILITIYSFFERNLFNFCKQFEIDQKIKIVDIRGTGVLLYKNYIEKILNISFVESEADWDVIKKYQKLRNFVTHESNYILAKSSDKIKDFKSIKGIELHETGNNFEVKIIDKMVFDEFLKAIRNIFHDIYMVKS